MANEVAHAQAKGTGVMSSVRWIREAYGPEVLKEVHRSLSPEVAEIVKNPLAVQWYPVSVLDQLWLGLRTRVHAGNDPAFEQAMIEQGKFIAEDNLSTVFRVLLAFVGSPEQMFKTLPRLWAQYFDGIDVANDESAIAEKRGSTRVHGLGNLHYIAPVVAGWTELGFKKVGAKHVRVREESYQEGKVTADPLVFHVAWS
ncbi:MAG: hypothetical protein PVG07_08025 [Acidobacteriota bacterium]|jgi:hypothetical protein